MNRHQVHKPTILAFMCILCASLVEAQVINAGVGGNSTRNLLTRVDSDVIHLNPDLVVLMVGTNDMLNSKKMVSYSEYTSNLESLTKKIKGSAIELILMSPPPVDSGYLFTRHDRHLFTETPNTKIDAVGKIMSAISQQEGAHFFDLNAKFKELNLPKHNRDLFIKNPTNSGKTDGVHPTPLGYHFIAENVFQMLKDIGLLKPGMKIICFGDSITRGDSADRNYPALLSQRIENHQRTN